MRTTRILLVVVGVGMVAYAAVAAVGSPDFNPLRHGLFLVAVLVAHELLLVPAYLGVGALVHRFVPGGYRAVVQGALIVTAAVTAVAVPLVLGYGRRPDIPSALPRDYPAGYAVVIGAVWLGAAALMGWRRLGAWRAAPRTGRTRRRRRWGRRRVTRPAECRPVR